MCNCLKKEKQQKEQKDKVYDGSEFPRSSYIETTARSLGPTLKSISKAWLPASQKNAPTFEHQNEPIFLDRGNLI